VYYIHYFNRLTPLPDAKDIQLVKGFFEGGEALNMHLHSVAVTLGNGRQIVLRSVQSLHSGYQLDQSAMDAMVDLFTARDLQLCEAHTQVNEKLRGYIKRVRSQFLNSEVSKVLFDGTISLESMLQHHLVVELVNSKSFLTCYRTVIPYFWIAKSEWVLAIIDTATSSVHFVHPFYDISISTLISSDERSTLNVFLKDKIESILQNSTVEEYVPDKWTFHMNIEENGRVTVVNGIRTAVYNANDSGLYVLYAMECDFFDTPIFAPDITHWSNFRTRMAYCLLSKQLLLF
jgi:hypothetical protein